MPFVKIGQCILHRHGTHARPVHHDSVYAVKHLPDVVLIVSGQDLRGCFLHQANSRLPSQIGDVRLNVGRRRRQLNDLPEQIRVVLANLSKDRNSVNRTADLEQPAHCLEDCAV